MSANAYSYTSLYYIVAMVGLIVVPLGASQEFATMPLPILWHIARYLPKESVGALRCTCRTMAQSIIDESDFWRVDERGVKAEFPKIHVLRRQELLQRVHNAHPDVKTGAILLVANYEQDAIRFIQESSFFYLTGINAAAVIMLIELDGTTTLFVPQFKMNRSLWVEDVLQKVCDTQGAYGIDHIVQLYKTDGYLSDLWTKHEVYNPLIYSLLSIIGQGGKIFTLCSNEPEVNEHQRLLLSRLGSWVDGFERSTVDISEHIGRMRCKKDSSELQEICKAIDGTAAGIKAAAHRIHHGATQYEVQACVDAEISRCGMTPAFATMVSSGRTSTILHYMSNSHYMGSGQLAMIDCGGKYHYGADITRTFPVSGHFTERQLLLYKAVLETQQYIAKIVRPGYFMKNPDNPKISLRHLAQDCLKARGLDKFFPHGVSHYLGLDTHDAGGYSEPLEEGAVITIEPGIYVPEEKIGIRIEDDFLITKQGAICLSRCLPKTPDDIQLMMQKKDCAI